MWVPVVVVLLVGLTAMYTAATRGVGSDSDTASLVLEGQSVLQGHLLLHGWALSLDSFWTSEVPFYAIADLIAGVRPLLLYLVPAFLYASVVVTCGALAAAAASSRSGAVAGVVAVAALLAFPTWAMSLVVLRGGHHLGAVLYSLAAFWCLRRGRWGWPAALAGVLLAAGMLGDLMTVAYGTAPLLVAGVVAMLRGGSVRDGRVQVGVAAAAAAGALVVREAAKAIGTFGIAAANPLAGGQQIVHNLRHLYSLGGELVGWKHTVFGTAGAPPVLYDLRMVGAVVVVACSALALLRLLAGLVAGGPADTARVAGRQGLGQRGARVPWWQSEPGGWRIDDALVAACFGAAATYVILAFANIPDLDRYLAPTALFMSLLTARVIARAWSRLAATGWGVLPAVGVVAVGITAAYGAAFGYQLATTPYPQPAPALASWLQAHHLTQGVGAYWAASLTTVEADGHVRVRPVIPDSNGHLVRYMRESAAEWYAGRSFDFLVFQPGPLALGVTPAEAAATWGPPAHQYAVDGYLVLVWARPFGVPATQGAGAGP